MKSIETLILSIIIHPVLLHIIGAFAVWFVTAYITRPRVTPMYYVPASIEATAPHTPPNAYRAPQQTRWGWLGLGSNSGRRGAIGSVMFTLLVYPMFGYQLWSNGHEPLVLIMGILNLVFPFVFGLILVNAIPYLSPAGGFWSLTCGMAGWYAAWVFRQTPDAMMKNQWFEVGAWIFLTFFVGIPLVFAFPLAIRKFSRKFPGIWLVEIANPLEAIFVSFAGDFAEAFGNVYRMNFYEGGDSHHHPHIPLPLGIVNMEDRILWTVFGVVPEGYTVQTPQGLLRGFPRHWAGTVSQRMSQRHMFGDDGRRNHITPNILVMGIPILVSLFFRAVQAVSGHGHGDHGQGSHSHESTTGIIKLVRRAENFVSQAIANRVGMETTIKLGYWLVALFPWLRHNVEDVHKAQHQHFDHLVTTLGNVGHDLRGRSGMLEHLAHHGLPAVGPGDFTLPEQAAIGAIAGLAELLEHVQQLFILDTGDGLAREALEDAEQDPHLKELWKAALSIHFNSNPVLAAELAEAIRLRVAARVSGTYGPILDFQGFKLPDQSIDPKVREAVAESVKTFVLDLDKSIGTGAFLNLSAMLQGTAGGNGRPAGGTPRGGSTP